MDDQVSFLSVCSSSRSNKKYTKYKLAFLQINISGTAEQLWDWGGGGAPLMTQHWGGGTRHFFLLILYNFKNIGGGHVPPAPPLLRGLGICRVKHTEKLCLKNSDDQMFSTYLVPFQ